jgi:hypothetical protein
MRPYANVWLCKHFPFHNGNIASDMAWLDLLLLASSLLANISFLDSFLQSFLVNSIT